MTDQRRPSLYHRAEFAGVQILSWGLAAGGATFAAASAWVLGHMFWLSSAYRRRIVATNLQIAFGDSKSKRELRRIARRSFVEIFLTAFEIILRERRPDLLKTPFREDPPLRDAFDEPTPDGLLVVSSHIGNWENAHWWCSQRGKPALSVGRILDNPLLDEWVRKLRGHHVEAETVLPVGGLRSVARILRSGRTVTLVVDQNKRKDPEWYDFFGVIAATHADWAKLAVRLRPRIVFASGIRTQFGEVYLPSKSYQFPEAGTDEERVRDLVETYLTWVEGQIGRYPEQYLWLHRRYRTRPEGHPPLYPSNRGKDRKRARRRRRREAAAAAESRIAL